MPTRRETLEVDALLAERRARTYLVRRGVVDQTSRRVAELVAQGLSNKEIATTLVVTAKAVEANLTRIYAKLGIRSRTELTRLLIQEHQ